jgi:hypothetical protein
VTAGPQADKLELKDVLVLVPTLASIMAVRWQIARFLPFGGFQYFSLTDHLLAALQALPFAATIVGFFGLIYAGSVGYTRNAAKLSDAHKIRGFVAFSGACLAGLLVGIVYDYVRGGFIPLSPLIGTGIFLLLIFNRLAFHYRPTRLATYVVGACAIIILTIAAAFDSSYGTIRHSWARRSTITLKSGPVEAIVLMTGDRGLLLYDPVNDRVTYRRLDDIERIDWKRSFPWPLF